MVNRWVLGTRRLAAAAIIVVSSILASAAVATAPAQALPHFIDMIKNDGNRKCLDVRTEDNYLVQLFDCHGTTNQQWIYGDPQNIGGLLYIQIINWRNSGCLEPAGGSRDVFVPIVVNPCSSADSQLWQPVWNGSQQTRLLVNRASGLCLDLRNNSSANATIIHLYWCDGNPAQVWRIDRGWF